jgi:hypothetical protein
MIFWKSNPSTLENLFILACLWGVIESLNTPMPRALYGTLFKSESTFSVFTFFQGLGFIIGYLISNFSCTNAKIYFLLSLAAICFICDLIRLRKRKSQISNNHA